MKFGDKLVELRKKNGYSQEELAEKLGVSRQSVSKWESNNTYPETDKIVQIANIFDCSMDDLINDKITDVETTLRKNKNNIYNMWDSLLEFITKTINMFSKMKFLDGFKCIIEMIIVALILALLGRIICSAASSAISSIFSFLSDNHVLKIKDILESIFDLIWLIIAVIALVHTFKIRYLNYYDKEISLDKINDYEEIAAYGTKVKYDEKYILAGNDKLMKKENIFYSPANEIGTVVYIAVNGMYKGYIVISDEIKEDSIKAIKNLKSIGIKQIVMLTGDNQKIANNIANKLGIDKVYSDLLPNEKVEKLEEIYKDKSEKEKVIFVGDGINDAPVLARADV